MTYTLFTLFPILLFALVTLWKLKLNYDTDIFQLQTRLAKVLPTIITFLPNICLSSGHRWAQ